MFDHHLPLPIIQEEKKPSVCIITEIGFWKCWGSPARCSNYFLWKQPMAIWQRTSTGFKDDKHVVVTIFILMQYEESTLDNVVNNLHLLKMFLWTVCTVSLYLCSEWPPNARTQEAGKTWGKKIFPKPVSRTPSCMYFAFWRKCNSKYGNKIIA